MLKTRVEDPRQATEEQIAQAAADTVPHVWPIFWAFRIMVGLGFGMLCMMGYFFWRASFRRMSFPRWALWLAVIATPAPWIAIEMGWIVAEYGRQPWTVAEVLPTALSVSHLTVAEVAVTLAGFVLLYSALFVVEMGLMFKYIRKGPHEDVALTEDWMRRHEDRLSGRAEVAK